MKFLPCSIPGCLEIVPALQRDPRGTFAKTFHEGLFAENGIAFRHAEEYFTHSERGVLRGLHFQVPPAAYAKTVCCVRGEVLDAIVDLRVGSPTFGRHETFTLSSDTMKLLYLPPGIAHGFFVTGECALMHYIVSETYSPENDRGIRWNSAGIPWPSSTAVTSERDEKFPALADFDSPFLFVG